MKDAPFRPLSTVVEKHGRKYTQLKRDGNVAMFVISGGGFEVIHIRIREEQKLPGGKIAPRRETYPSDEEFGTHGWYYPKEYADMAEQKFQTACTKFNTPNA